MRTLVLTAFAAALCLPTWAAEPSVNPEEIIHKFAAKEAEFREARANYTYRQSAKVEELDPSGNPTGHKWEEVQDILFVNGKRVEKVVYAPVTTLQAISLTPQDMTDLREVQPFVLTTSEIDQYNVTYLGPEKVDEIGCYVFSVKPKKLEQGKRYFEGQIWVDDRDYQIVKTYGKGVGLLKKGEDNQFPRFETYREQVDGKYWFPTYTRADDTLHFKTNDQRIRMVVKYQDYKKYQGSTSIRYGDVVDESTTPPPPPATKKQ